MKSGCRTFLGFFVSLIGLSAGATVRYVNVNGTNATPPYTNWATAATLIQDAVDAAASGDEVLVTNGVYAAGGSAAGANVLVNRVAVDRPITLRSVNGPQFTLIQGYQVPGATNGDGAIRCVYLTNGASLIGFTLTNGATRWVSSDPTFAEASGGGVWCESRNVVISNCVVTGNSAHGSGGGVYGGTLYNCRLEGNDATGFQLSELGGGGGGAYWALLYNCIVAGNRSEVGGGAYYGNLNNCIVKDNHASNHGGGGFACTFRNCTVVGNSAVGGGGGASECNVYNSIIYYNTAPDYPDRVSCWTENSCSTPLGSFGGFGSGNINNAPLFVNMVGGNLRLQPSSPCINAGHNSHAVGLTDFDGNPRIKGNTVDIGAYEFQAPASAISYAWLQQYALPINASTDYADPDGDGMNTWQEWRADTVPTNALSVLRMVTVTNGSPGLRVTWQSVPSRRYWLDRATNLTSLPAFLNLKSNINGQAGTTTYTDPTATNSGSFFYRVGVQP